MEQLQTTYTLHDAQRPLSTIAMVQHLTISTGVFKEALVSRFTTLLDIAFMSTHPPYAGLVVSPVKGLSFSLSSLPYL